MNHEDSIGEEGTQESAVDERHCEHIREDGTRCKGWKVKGEALCSGHLGRGIAADPARYAQAGAEASAQVRQGSAEQAKRRAVDVYRDAVERNARNFVAIREQIANDPRAAAGDRLRAMEQLEARALGRPTEHVQVEDVRLPSSVEEIAAMTPEQRRAALVELNRTGTDD